MRVIKFRGKANDGRWVYGGLVYGDVIQTAIYFEAGNMAYRRVDWAYVDPATVGQFTGLYDKNGKEIYEGDIISSEKHPHNKHLIFYNEKQGRFMAGLHGNTDISAFGVCGIDDTTWMATKEVVGNVYDNHKLLKDENN